MLFSPHLTATKSPCNHFNRLKAPRRARRARGIMAAVASVSLWRGLGLILWWWLVWMGSDVGSVRCGANGELVRWVRKAHRCGGFYLLIYGGFECANDSQNVILFCPGLAVVCQALNPIDPKRLHTAGINIYRTHNPSTRLICF